MTTQPQDNHTFILNVTCQAGTGVVAAISTYLATNDCYICALEQFDDESTNKFFLRAVFRLQSKSPDIESLKSGFFDIADQFKMKWDIYDPSVPTKVLIMVSKSDHCLDDLLYRRRNGELHMEVTAVVSNHKDLRPMVEREGIRFIHLPISKETKASQVLLIENCSCSMDLRVQEVWKCRFRYGLCSLWKI